MTMLLVFNKSAAPITLSGLTVVVPLSAAPPARGPGVNVTSELRGLSGGQYTALEAQRALGSLEYEWTGDPEYSVSPLAFVGPALPNASATAAGSMTAAQFNKMAGGSMARYVRGAALYPVADLNNFPVVDPHTGITYGANERILLCQQPGATPYVGAIANGIYKVTQIGVPGAGLAILQRAEDYDVGSEVFSGSPIVISGLVSGSVAGFGDKAVTLLLATVGPIVIGTTALMYDSAASTVTASKMKCRGMALANIADLTNVSVTQDGNTFTAGQTFALVTQTDRTQNGVYTFGTISGGFGALTRVAEYMIGNTTNFGDEITVMSGTIGNGLVFRLPISTTIIGNAGANLPFEAHTQKGRATLSGGTVTVPAFISATSSIDLTPVDTSGASLTARYTAPTATRLPGANGAAGTFVINAEKADSSLSGADGSTVDWIVVNGPH